MSQTIQFNERANLSKSQIYQLRKQGQVPAIVYGQDVGTIPVMVNEKEILSVVRNRRAILNATIPNKGNKPVLIQHIQRDPLTRQMIHIDFHQLNMNENIDSKVTVNYSGDPVGVKEGGVLQVELYEVEVRCMPDRLPGAFEVDVSGLKIGDQLLVSDIASHEGIEVLTDPEAMLVKVSHAQTEEAETTE